MSKHKSPPKFFDLQVNGFFGADFNDERLSSEKFHTAIDRLSEDNVDGILATIITDSHEAMVARIRRLVELIGEFDDAESIVKGLHIEGPFISPVEGYVGAHPVEHTQVADKDQMRELLDAGDGLVRLVTLAPEQDPGASLTRLLTDNGVCVSAGHCDPSRDQLVEAIDQGLSMFTHLGNGCPADMHRHDNIIQRVLSLADRLYICFIADGFHVPFVALANYLKCVPPDKLIFTTDCIAAAGLGAGTYTLAGQNVRVEEGKPPTAADGSHFIGSSAQMPDMYKRLKDELGLSVDQLAYSMSELPREAVGL